MTQAYLRMREVMLQLLDRAVSSGQNGQGMVEYALILVLIAVVVIVILKTLGGQVNNAFSNVSNALGR
jgi:pilus assembly protein Flp/PilA